MTRKATVANALHRYWPALLLAALLAWGWQHMSLAHSVSSYGDTMEFMWVLSWYGDALRSGQSIAVYPLAFYPAGWYYAENLLMLVAMLPLVWIGGAALAYNVVVLVSFVAAFAGGYLLARRFLAQLPATVAAVLITFAGIRWFHHIGHINILIGSALTVWLLLALERALRAPGKNRNMLVAAGILWAASMSGSLYFAFIGALAVATWTAGYLSAGTITWRKAFNAIAIPSVTAALLILPNVVWLWSNSAQTGVGFYPLGEVNFWGASLNALPTPSIDHPWLGSLARDIYRGIPFEQGAANLGLLAVLLAIVGFALALRQRRWRPVLFLAVAGVVLSLGITLKWDNESLHVAWLRPLNQALWQLGHWLKPALFDSAQPPAPFDTAVPLPGMLAAILIPFLDRARVFARFALVGGVGVFLLAGLGLTAFRNRWIRVALAALLIVEVMPAPLHGRPFPPAPHPAFVWLQGQSMPDESVADLVAGHPYTPVLLNEGESVWATLSHGKATVAGASSIWPAHTMFLYQWLGTHEHAFWNADLAPMLRFFSIRYLLLHMRSDLEAGILEEASQNTDFRLVNCFDPAPGDTPWSYPICVLELLPPANPNVNLILEEGWSGMEPWGVWAEGVESRAMWVASAEVDHRLRVEAFPLCLDAPGRSISVVVNGVTLATHKWEGCDPWSAELTVPGSLVRLGENDLVLTSSHAARPVEISGGENPDPRLLSAGFNALQIELKGR